MDTMTGAAGKASQPISGLVLAGGRGSRMGGVDKGLQMLAGQPLAWHALQRLRPQVGPIMISANRHLVRYAGLGVPVWPDVMPEHPGPLAGMLAGLTHCSTPWLACVPCDSPCFPVDLVARLAAACAAEGSEIAVAATLEDGEQGQGAADATPRRLRMHPVFCLLDRRLAPGLAQALLAGERKVGRWMAAQRCSVVGFDDAQAFFNVNTEADLRRLADGFVEPPANRGVPG
jgi:molybdopterin-guanine dinucleotide biosynthesis protein A